MLFDACLQGRVPGVPARADPNRQPLLVVALGENAFVCARKLELSFGVFGCSTRRLGVEAPRDKVKSTSRVTATC